MTRWISGSSYDDTSQTPNSDNAWNKGDCFGGKVVKYELPKLSYFIVYYYMYLTELDL